jgi:hydroxymethylglutaryl-CoA synthase
MKTGIDAIDFYVPNLYMSIKDLAEYRNISYEKLNKGLGLHKMAIPDVGEDAASFAANALLSLLTKNNIDPTTIGRIYLGTESALDSSKPTATYAVEVVEKELSKTYGERCFKNCDVVDMTFACIGAVDAFQNCVDWVRNNPTRKAIVIASDVAKYDLGSTGEYTQGAGAVAVLVGNNPSIIEIDDVWGVATKSEGDFFKPRREFNKDSIIEELIQTLNIDIAKEEVKEKLINSTSKFWSDENTSYKLYKEEPVFDGQFSNQCYSDRISEAFDHFNNQKETDFNKDWNHLIFHLPYAFHGRRIIFNNWIQWLKKNDSYKELEDEIGVFEDAKDWKRAAVKSKLFKVFIDAKIAPGEKASSDIGNMYTASIFMSLLSMLSYSFNQKTDITNNKIGFIAYGSGSKSKIFEGVVCEGWERKIKDVQLFEYLNSRTAINEVQYKELHTGAASNCLSNSKAVKLTKIERSENILGLRRYSL